MHISNEQSIFICLHMKIINIGLIVSEFMLAYSLQADIMPIYSSYNELV